MEEKLIKLIHVVKTVNKRSVRRADKVEVHFMKIFKEFIAEAYWNMFVSSPYIP